MLAILSPAKDMKVVPEMNSYRIEATTPQFINDSAFLVDEMKLMGVKELIDILCVSKKLGDLSQHRFQVWNKQHTLQNASPAIIAYTGEAYRGLNAKDFSEKDFIASSKYLRILSGLYGVLLPADLIQEYRLEMGTKKSFGKANSLYAYWGDRITDAINEAVVLSPGEKVLINLASAEYYAAVSSNNLKYKVITPVFKQETDGKLKQVVVYTKRARGMMARFIITNQLQHAEDIKAFDAEGYFFDSRNSTGTEWLFVR